MIGSMQLQSGALLKLVLPVALVALSFWSKNYLGDLSEELRIVVLNMPYLSCAAALIMAHQFSRIRLLLAALGVAALYWVLRNQLQVSLSEPHAEHTFLVASFCLPFLFLYLILLPERGIWNLQGLLTLLGFAMTAALCFSAAAWVASTGSAYGELLMVRPMEGYVLSLGATGAIAAVMLVGIFLLCLRNSDTESALLASLLALYLALALLHLEYISVAMCTAASLCLVYGLLRSSHAMAYRDDLTGLLGRRALNERLSGLGRRYTIAMLDVDHFKKFNDNHGHDVGDQVLQLVASRIRQVGGGTAYRYGGEEFCIVYPRKSVEQCAVQLEELRASIAEYQMALRDNKLRPKKSRQGSQKRGASRLKAGQVSVTVSIGVAERSDEQPDPESVIQAADAKLYRAKRAGRNRVVS
jgi:diguanylate cyclase (GGDEF)-like protein